MICVEITKCYFSMFFEKWFCMFSLIKLLAQKLVWVRMSLGSSLILCKEGFFTDAFALLIFYCCWCSIYCILFETWGMSLSCTVLSEMIMIILITNAMCTVELEFESKWHIMFFSISNKVSTSVKKSHWWKWSP